MKKKTEYFELLLEKAFGFTLNASLQQNNFNSLL